MIIVLSFGIIASPPVNWWAAKCVLRSLSVSIVSMSSPLIRGRLIAM
jgi:hypothetical protein